MLPGPIQDRRSDGIDQSGGEKALRSAGPCAVAAIRVGSTTSRSSNGREIAS